MPEAMPVAACLHGARVAPAVWVLLQAAASKPTASVFLTCMEASLSLAHPTPPTPTPKVQVCVGRS